MPSPYIPIVWFLLLCHFLVYKIPMLLSSLLLKVISLFSLLL